MPTLTIRAVVRRLAVTLAVVATTCLAAPRSTAAADQTAGIVWSDCGPSLECARVRVPLDWKRPRGRSIELAVLRHLASRPDRRLGTVFFNPGGPGSSGVGAIRDSGALLDAMAQGRFDFVTWDPRGVGESAEVRCFANDAEETAFWGDLVVPSSAADAERYARTARDYARRCGQVDRRLLRHISTADTIRDLDHLRRLLGEEQLNYVGWSYGTFLGQSYVNKWPRRVRAMVLDGVVDAVAYVKGRESSLANIVHPSDEVGGPVLGWWLWAPCAAWPVASAERYTGPWNARTENPVLVVGTRFDPNTSYANAVITAKRLRNAVLLTHDGYGHISFVDPSRCVVRAMGEYLVDLKTPAPGTVCPSDRLPFDPQFGEPLPDPET